MGNNVGAKDALEGFHADNVVQSAIGVMWTSLLASIAALMIVGSMLCYFRRKRNEIDALKLDKTLDLTNDDVHEGFARIKILSRTCKDGESPEKALSEKHQKIWAANQKAQGRETDVQPAKGVPKKEPSRRHSIELMSVPGNKFSTGSTAPRVRRLAEAPEYTDTSSCYVVAVPVLTIGLLAAWFIRRYLNRQEPKMLIPRYHIAIDEPEQVAPARRMSDQILGFTAP